jgi:hypothetical protein
MIRAGSGPRDIGRGGATTVAMIATVAWTVQALAPAMGGARPMLGTATVIAAIAAAVGGLSLLALRREAWLLHWINWREAASYRTRVPLSGGPI